MSSPNGDLWRWWAAGAAASAAVLFCAGLVLVSVLSLLS